MGFEDEYFLKVDEVDYDSRKKETFLEFWGYECDLGCSYSNYTRDDGYTATIRDNEIDIRKKTRQISSSLYWYEYQRKHIPTPKEKELENHFYELVEKKYSKKSQIYPYEKIFRIEKTPYLCTSPEEYQKLRPKIINGRLTIAISALPLLYMVIMTCIEMIQEGLWLFILPELIGVTIGGALIGAIIMAPVYFLLWPIVRLFIWPYNWYGRRGKERIRKIYLRGLSVGIPKANKILREYAILRGYDKI